MVYETIQVTAVKVFLTEYEHYGKMETTPRFGQKEAEELARRYKKELFSYQIIRTETKTDRVQRLYHSRQEADEGGYTDTISFTDQQLDEFEGGDEEDSRFDALRQRECGIFEERPIRILRFDAYVYLKNE